MEQRTREHWKRKLLSLLLVFTMVFSGVSQYGPFYRVYAEAGDTPATSKLLQDNGDGTYKLALSVTGEAEKKVTRTNVTVILDRSGSMNTTRMNAAKTAIKNLSNTLLGYNGVDGNPTDTFEMALVTFSNLAELYSTTPTTSARTFSNAVDATSANGGTNWEDALQKANAVNYGDNDQTFVIFVSDGNPTFRNTEGNYPNHYNDYNSDYYRNYGVWGSGSENDTTVSRCYDHAVDDARTLAQRIGVTRFYTIGAYGNVDRMEDLTTDAGAPADNYFSAADTTALNAAFEKILDDIKMAGFADVEIDDPTTSSVSYEDTSLETKTVELLEIVESSFKYYRAGGKNSDGSTKYNPAVNTITPVGGSAQQIGVEWTDIPEEAKATIDENGQVKWDLSSIGVLEDGVKYTVTFDVYPSQTTYDYIAQLKNGSLKYSELPEEIQEYIINLGNGNYTLRTNKDYPVIKWDDTRDDAGRQESSMTNPEPVGTDASQMTIIKTWDNSIDDIQKEGLDMSIYQDDAFFFSVRLDDGNNYTNSCFIAVGLLTTTKDNAGNVTDVRVLDNGHDYVMAEPVGLSYNWDLISETVHPMLIDGVMATLVKADAPTGMTADAKYYKDGNTEYYRIGQSVYKVTATGGATVSAYNQRRNSLILTKHVDTKGFDIPEGTQFTFTMTVDNKIGTGEDEDVWFSIHSSEEYVQTNMVYDFEGTKVSGAEAETLAIDTTQTATVSAGNVVSVDGDHLTYQYGGNNYTVKIASGPAEDGSYTYYVYEIVGQEGNEVTYKRYGVEYTAPYAGMQGDLYTYYTGFYHAPNNTAVTVKLEDGEFVRFVNLPIGSTYSFVEQEPTDGFSYDSAKAEIKTGTASSYGTDADATVTDGTRTVEGTLNTGNSFYKTTYTNTMDQVDVSATKIWDDNDNQDGKRTAATFHLNQSVGGAAATVIEGQDKTIAADATGDALTVTWENLPTVDSNGEAITYSVTEDPIDGYTTVITKDTEKANSFIITNSHTPELVDVTVKKVWDDNEDQDGKRPESLEVTLSNGDKVTLNEDNGWTATITELPKYANGVEIEYTWTEASIEGYTLSGTAKDGTITTLTNKHVPEVTTRTVVKIWDDNDNQDGKRPQALNITLQGTIQGENEEGETVTKTVSTTTITLPIDGKWTKTVENLPVYAEGKVINYVFVEDTTNMPGYSPVGEPVISEDGLRTTFTNKHTPDTTKIEVTKTWSDNNNQDGKRASVGATVQLYKQVGDNEPEAVGQSVAVGTADDWNNIWTDLPVYENGKKISYYVVETLPNGSEYTKSGDGEANAKEATAGDSGTIAITNSYTPEITKVAATKTWSDNNNQDGKRSNDYTVRLYKFVDNTLTPVGEAESVPVTDGQIKVWENLPVYENGKKISYYVIETLPDGSEYTKSGDGQENAKEATAGDSGTIAITNSYTPEITKVTATKTWSDNNNQDGKRARVGATVQLYKTVDGVKTAVGDPVPVSAVDGKITEWTNLPVYEGGKQITYSVEETLPTNTEYTKSGDDKTLPAVKNDSGTIAITNSYNVELTKVTVTKTWADKNDQDGKRSTVNATVQLYKKVGDGEKVAVGQPVAVGTADDWSHVFENLPVYEDGKQITYSVEETLPANSGYTKSGDEKTLPAVKNDSGTIAITNSYEPEKTSATVEKIWNDANNQDGKRPTELVVSLLADGEDTGKTVTLNDNNGWKDTIVGLDKKANGKDISYTWAEDETKLPEGYTMESNVTNAETLTTTITNTYTPEETKVTVEKIWDDNDNQDGKRKDVGATVQLYKTVGDAEPVAVGEPVEVGVDDADGNWTNVWEKLPVYENGTVIVYTVEETLPEGTEYTKSGDTTKLTAKAGDSGKVTITNSYVPEKTKVTVTKTWADSNDQDGKRKDVNATVQLYKLVGEESEAVGTVVTVGTLDDWSNEWTDLPVYEDGVKIYYYVVETLPDGSEYTKSGDGEENAVEAQKTDSGEIAITNTYTPEETKVTVTKTWADSDDQDGKRKDVNATVQLYKKVAGVKTAVGEPVAVGTEDDWSNVWEKLPVYENGETIIYSVEETLPEGSEYTKSGDDKTLTAKKTDSGTIEITNSYNVELTTVTVTKTWVDANDQDGKRKDVNATVQLYKTVDGVKTAVGEPVAVGTEDNWSKTWSQLPVYEGGKQISYSVEEILPADSEYTKSGDGELLPAVKGVTGKVEITNSYTPELTEATVKKVWDDNNDQDGIRPKSLTVTLSDGTVITLNDENKWEATVSNLPKYENHGTEIVYTWTEAEDKLPEGYKLTSTVKNGTVTTLTNSHTPETVDVNVLKIWSDKDNELEKRPESITINLLAGDAVKETVTVTADNKWAHTFAALPKYEDHGKEIVYTITEDAVAEYTTTIKKLEPVKDENGKIVSYTINVTNTIETSDYDHTEIELIKVDENNEELQGATFTVYTTKVDENGKVTKDAELTTFTGGTITISSADEAFAKILPGLQEDGKSESITLIIQETTAPDGYDLDPTEYVITITATGDRHYVVEETTTDETTEGGEAGETTEGGEAGEATEGGEAGEATEGGETGETTEGGEAGEATEGGEAGAETEDEEELEGGIWVTTTHYVITIDKEDKYVINTKVTGSRREDDQIDVFKTGTDQFGEVYPLAGAEFTLYDAEGNAIKTYTTEIKTVDNEEVSTFTIDTAGEGFANILKDLALTQDPNPVTFNWTLKETKAPKGYALDDTVYNVTVTGSVSEILEASDATVTGKIFNTVTVYTITFDNNEKTLTVNNDKVTERERVDNEIIITKVGQDKYGDKSALAGAFFAITDEDGNLIGIEVVEDSNANVETGTTGIFTISTAEAAEGEGTIFYLSRPDLNDGESVEEEYGLQETQAPENYQLDDTKYTIIVRGTGVETLEDADEDHPNGYYLTTTTYEISIADGEALEVINPQLYGNLEITKTVPVFKAGRAATFVFRVTWEYEDKATGKKIEKDEIVALTFTEAGEKSAVIEGIPAGAQVTVEEIYSGASYKLTSDKTVDTTIVANETATVGFTNEYDEELPQGYGILNEFAYKDDKWAWTANKTDSAVKPGNANDEVSGN